MKFFLEPRGQGFPRLQVIETFNQAVAYSKLKQNIRIYFILVCFAFIYFSI